MGLIKEPKNIDFSMKSEPWTDKELIEFRKLMQTIKVKNSNKKVRTSSKTSKSDLTTI